MITCLERMNRVKFFTVGMLAAMAMTAGAATNIWNGNTSTNWSDANNWSLTTVPGLSANVSVPSGTTYAPTVTNATADLASLVLASGQTLTVSGWDSTITATEMTIGGTITHLANNVTETNALGGWDTLHRVWLEGSNITIEVGSEIDADYLGYPPGAGPGMGIGSVGGAHAGAGRRGFAGGTPAPAYGDPAAPVQPGSGGKIEGDSRPGGGAIRINATGTLTINGEIRANGQNTAGTGGSGGTGGSIWLTCRTLAGSATGLVTVNGGSGYSVGIAASAGRIALDYNKSAQADLAQPRPPIRFSGAPGVHISSNSGDRLPAAMGTLYLPDTLLIFGLLDADRFHYMRLVIPEITTWSPDSLTLNDCILGLPDGLHLVVTNDLVLTNGAALHFFAAPVSDPLTEDGALVEVGGDLRMYDNCWVFPYADNTNGATVKITIDGDLLVADGGGFNADDKGYRYGYGPGSPPNSWGGGGYGGVGGEGFDGKIGGVTYGNPRGPMLAGSSGGTSQNLAGLGGGAIRLEVAGNAEIHGLLTARGAPGVANHGPGGSGGGIRITCQTLQGSGTALLRADGGLGSYYGGNGGGGRIAVLYDPAAQAALTNPRPDVRFSTYAYSPTSRGYLFSFLAEMGTLYFPDTILLADTPSSDTVLNNHRFWHTQLVISNRFDEWAPASLIISNCVVGFPTGYHLDVGGDLTLSSSGSLPSDLTGSPEGGLQLYAAATSTLYGARLDVGGNLQIQTNAWLYPHASGTNGAVVGIRVAGDFTAEAGGGINADGKGYFPVVGDWNGAGAGQDGLGGGGYGGAGGGANGGVTYGMAVAPLEPGSPGGWRSRGDYTPTGKGGGAIHVVAGGQVTIDGTLLADGWRGNYWHSPPGSGGSIFVTGRRVSGSGTLSAQGGKAYQTYCGGGGGGRIAVWHHILPIQVDARIASQDYDALVYSYPYVDFSGELLVDAGTGNLEYVGDPGTLGFYDGRVQGTLIILK